MIGTYATSMSPTSFLFQSQRCCNFMSLIFTYKTKSFTNLFDCHKRQQLPLHLNVPFAIHIVMQVPQLFFPFPAL